MKVIKMALFLLAFVVSGAVFARAPEPVINVVDQPITITGGKKLTVDEVKQIISKVAQEKKWVVAPMQNGNLVATLSWKSNKHVIAVEIVCDTDRFSITYRDSVNMNYAVTDSQPVIHPYYNRFVGELRDAIRVETMRM